MISEIQTLAEDVGQLVAFPDVYWRIGQLLEDPDSEAHQIAQFISQDPALSVRVLRIANSPFFGLSREVDSVARAVTVLGMARVREAVQACAAGQVLTEIPNEVIFIEDFWHHSIYCGLIAKALATRSSHVKEDFAFVTGLLHDIGQLVLFNRYPGEMRVALDLLAEGERGLQMHTVEQKVLGFDHVALGAALLHAWHLPERMQECVEFHHHPEGAQRYPVETAVIHLANALAHLAQADSNDLAEAPPIDARAWQTAGLEPDIVATVIDEAHGALSSVKAMLVLDGGS